jgi:DNA topoisomerase-1
MTRSKQAQSPRLVFVDDSLPGISRQRAGKSWHYREAEGKPITASDEITRLNAIALPPVYREAEKFDGCAGFGRMLPLIRARVEDDLAAAGLTLARAVASIVRLLDTGGIGIGNEAYVKANKSFGATTLRMRHADIKGQTLKLRFTAKSGKLCEMKINDRGLARFDKQMPDLPGQHLFQYLDDAGAARPVTSGDVSTRLSNTPAIGRKSYIHPAVLDLVAVQEDWRGGLVLPRKARWLSRAERALIAFLAEAGANPVAAPSRADRLPRRAGSR